MMKINFKELLHPDGKDLQTSVELTQTIIKAILAGRLAPSMKLPPVNEMGQMVGLNRLTVLKSMTELEIEGWVTKKERSGIYINKNLPVINPDGLKNVFRTKQPLPKLAKNQITPLKQNFFRFSFNDGYPDHRLFPVREMARIYSTTLKDHHDKSSILYYDVFGHQQLREALSRYINNSRGIRNAPDNIIITRGSTMGIYLTTKVLCNRGESVAMTAPGYYLARETFESEGLEVLSVEVDQHGLCTDHLESLLKRYQVKMIYVTPHHHYPTTVTLSAQRRMELLKLAETYNFYILEDDYDFEFQYDRRPILPVASIDQLQRVIYVGGFSKSLSPSIRIGYLVANPQIIFEAGKWRKLIDRQGDTIQELVFSTLLNSGLIEKTIRKALKTYLNRRNYAFSMLQERLSTLLEPQFCEGGLSFWTRFKCSSAAIKKFISRAYEAEIFIVAPEKFNTPGHNFTRMGFASMDELEMKAAIEKLSKLIE